LRINKIIEKEGADAFWGALVEGNFLLPNLNEEEVFIRSDDTDGETKGIEIHFLGNKDGVIDFTSIDNFRGHGTPHVHRFRTWHGGSMNPRIQKILHILAFAFGLSKRQLPEKMVKEKENLKLEASSVYEDRDMD
jgi:hypothetical protein